MLFNQIVIHRGRYHREPPRRTFMISFRKRRVTEATLARRGLDQYSDQPWFLAPDYLDGTAPATRRYFSEYTAFYAAQWRSKLAEMLKYQHDDPAPARSRQPTVRPLAIGRSGRVAVRGAREPLTALKRRRLRSSLEHRCWPHRH